jgi:hypothetical protein
LIRRLVPSSKTYMIGVYTGTVYIENSSSPPPPPYIPGEGGDIGPMTLKEKKMKKRQRREKGKEK